MADPMELARAMREVRRKKYERKMARVAQRTEHRATDAGAAGSIPAASTRFLRHIELTKAKTFNVADAIPTRPGESLTETVQAARVTSLPVPDPEPLP